MISCISLASILQGLVSIQSRSPDCSNVVFHSARQTPIAILTPSAQRFYAYLWTLPQLQDTLQPSLFILLLMGVYALRLLLLFIGYQWLEVVKAQLERIDDNNST
jgi:hypothetical protein